MKRAWKRFRGLHPAAQAGVALGVVAAYTVALVLLLGGGGGDDGEDVFEADVRTTSERQPVTRTALERRVGRIVQRSGRPKAESTDVERFLRPYLRRVRCDGAPACDVVYASGLPGGGRILEDQQAMVRRIFTDTPVSRVRISTVRGGPRETGVPPKAGEETPVERLLVQTECDRSSIDDARLARLSALQLQMRLCRLGEADPAGTPQRRGVPGGDPGDQGPTGPPGGG